MASVWGQTRCSRASCSLCSDNTIQIGNQVVGTAAGLIWHIRQPFTCDAKNVVYLITCAQCRAQYVGETDNFKGRVQHHKSEIRNPGRDASAVVTHFRSHGWENFRVTCLESAPPGNNMVGYRRRHETYFIHFFGSTLNTVTTQSNISHAFRRSRPAPPVPAPIILRSRYFTPVPEAAPREVEMEG